MFGHTQHEHARVARGADPGRAVLDRKALASQGVKPFGREAVTSRVGLPARGIFGADEKFGRRELGHLEVVYSKLAAG